MGCCTNGDFRSSILPALDAADQVIGQLGLATTAVTIVTRKWSGGERMVGNYGDTILQLPLWTVVREISNRELMQSGGAFTMGDLMIGPIRPSFTQIDCSGGGSTGASNPVQSPGQPTGQPGGFTAEQLQPFTTDDSTEFFYRVVQEHGLGTGWNGDYELIALQKDDPLAFYAVIRRMMEAQDHPPPLAP